MENVIIDLDGTIIGIREDILRSIIKKILEDLKIYSEDILDKIYKRMLFSGVKPILGNKYIEFWDLFNKYFSEIDYKKKYFIYPDAIYFLKNFEGNLVVVSDAPLDEIENKVKLIELHGIKLEYIISTNPKSENKVNGINIRFNYKPDPRSLEWIINNIFKKFSKNYKETFVIGDSIFDVLYGAGNGKVTILINRYNVDPIDIFFIIANNRRYLRKKEIHIQELVGNTPISFEEGLCYVARDFVVITSSYKMSMITYYPWRSRSSTGI